MTYQKNYTSLYNSDYDYKSLTHIDNFEMFERHIRSIVAWSPSRLISPQYSTIHIALSINGDFFVNTDGIIDFSEQRVERAHIIPGIEEISDLYDMLPIGEFMYNERERTYSKKYPVDPMLLAEINKYGLNNLSLRFYGIEINAIPSSNYCQCVTLATIEGRDAETFHNARILTL